MSHKRGQVAGPKFNGRHQTIIEGADPAVQAAKECPFVTKISIGPITPSGHGKPRIKLTETANAIRLQVRGNTATQIFWLYTANVARTIQFIQERWDRDL